MSQTPPQLPANPPPVPPWPWLLYVPSCWYVYPPPPWWPPYPSPLCDTPAPARPRVWTVYVAWLVGVAGIIAASVVAGIGYVVYCKATGQGVPDMARLLAFLLSFRGLCFLFLGNLIATGATSLVAATLSSTPLRRRLAFTAPAIGWPSIIALAIAATGVGHFLGMLVHLLGIPVNGTMVDLMRSLAGFSTAEQLAMLTMIGLLAPITEELLFRGYIQTRLVQRHGPLPGILITSVLFGLMHMDLYQSPATFFVGLALGFAAWYGRSIIPAIAGHVVNNTIAVGLTITTGAEDTMSWRGAFIWMLASAMLVLLGIGFALWRGRREMVLASD